MSPMLGILQQNKELSSHTLYQRPESSVQNLKNSPNLEVFSNFNIH